MTNKELLYVEDALGHEEFMQSCAQKTQTQLQNKQLAEYAEQLEQQHNQIFNNFLNLL